MPREKEKCFPRCPRYSLQRLEPWYSVKCHHRSWLMECDSRFATRQSPTRSVEAARSNQTRLLPCSALLLLSPRIHFSSPALADLRQELSSSGEEELIQHFTVFFLIF
uniref:HD domain containing protein n=1 Tax=Arundo donax TaxID=35708 RepID=A0A0A9GEJ8_ARUDO